MECLLQYGADPLRAFDATGRSCLHIAVASFAVDTVRLLTDACGKQMKQQTLSLVTGWIKKIGLSHLWSHDCSILILYYLGNRLCNTTDLAGVTPLDLAEGIRDQDLKMNGNPSDEILIIIRVLKLAQQFKNM